MRVILIACITAMVFGSCNNGEKIPDVSNIKVSFTTDRFEKKLFDTTAGSLASYLQRLQSTSPSFTQLFIYKILNADPRWPADTTAAYVNQFVSSYKPMYRDAEKIFSDFSKYEKEIEKASQYVKYYFPSYKLPSKIITYLGPADGYGDGISEDAFIVGLHYHLGKDNPLYKTELVLQVYPEYVSKRFEPENIPVTLMTQVVNELYPEKESDKPLVEQMVEKGKRLYLLSKFLPHTPEFRLINYTEQQMKDCYKYEARVWNMFVSNSLLQSVDKNIMRNYIEESPKTQELGEDAPGNIGSFAGWQIVKKYMKQNPSTTLQQLMAKDAESLFQEAKYKPE